MFARKKKKNLVLQIVIRTHGLLALDYLYFIKGTDL